MSFWRRWLKQWGYVRIRDYGLVVTDAGQVIRVADGAVVNAVMAPMPARDHAPLPPAQPRPLTPQPLHSPLRLPATVESAPAFAPLPPVPATVDTPRPRLPLPPVPRAQPAPPATVTRASPARRRPTASTVPPIARREPMQPRAASFDSEQTGDTTVVDEEPTLREPPLRAGIATRRSLPSLSSIGAQVGDATVVDDPPRSRPGAALPRLSARLASRRKSG